ncbi:MAG: protein kinase [Myxococcota bacterium]
MEESLPERFGPFLLVRLLGAGGMGKAYLARHNAWPGMLVVKRMHQTLLDDESLTKRFTHEAEVATHVRHPNVASLIAMGTVEKEPFFATEYVFGLPISTLVDRIEEKLAEPLPLAVALFIAIGIARGVEAIHDAVHSDTGAPLDLVHRDIGSRNVLLGADGIARLIDLGLGKSVLADWQTAANLLAGSPDFMAPEQALGRPVDRRADVYATAVTIWELLAGRKRIREASVPQRITRALEAQPEPLIPYRKEASPALEALLKEAMAPLPERRLPTATLLRAGLEKELAQLRKKADAADVRAWLEAQCATALAKERRALEDARQAEGAAEDDGHTRILVAHTRAIEAQKDLDDATLAPRAIPRTSRPAAARESTVLNTPGPTVPERARLFLLGIGGLVVMAVAVLLAIRVTTPPPPVHSVPITPEPIAAPTPEPTELPSDPEPSPTEAALDPADAGVHPDAEELAPIPREVSARKPDLLARLKSLRRQRYEISFQKRLTALGQRISRARTEREIEEIEAQLSRLERE